MINLPVHSTNMWLLWTKRGRSKSIFPYIDSLLIIIALHYITNNIALSAMLLHSLLPWHAAPLVIAHGPAPHIRDTCNALSPRTWENPRWLLPRCQGDQSQENFSCRLWVLHRYVKSVSPAIAPPCGGDLPGNSTKRDRLVDLLGKTLGSKPL